VKLYTQDHSVVPLNPRFNFCATTGNVIGCASFEAVGSAHNGVWPYSGGPKAIIKTTGNAGFRFWASGFDIYVSSSYSVSWRGLSDYATSPTAVGSVPSGALEFVAL